MKIDMGKKFSSIFMAVVFAALTTFVAVEGAEAFCVYNNTDIRIYVAKIGGRDRDFKKDIPTGRNVCCDWQTEDCNPTEKGDSVVRFYVSTQIQQHGERTLCERFPIKVGGKLVVEGKDGHYLCSTGDRIK